MRIGANMKKESFKNYVIAFILIANLVFIGLFILDYIDKDDSSNNSTQDEVYQRYEVVSLNDNNYVIIDHLNNSITLKGIASNSYSSDDISIISGSK
jgi:hypothetical protein